MKIHFINRQRDLALSCRSVRRVVKAICSYLSISCEEISIFFVTEKKSSEFHRQFFHDPTPTDCMSFPIDSSYLGDILICPAVAIRFAAARKKDPYLEILLYMVHGLLHLIGYDDIEPAARRTMRKMEKKCMDHLNEIGLTRLNFYDS